MSPGKHTQYLFISSLFGAIVAVLGMKGGCVGGLGYEGELCRWSAVSFTFQFPYLENGTLTVESPLAS